ncbi:NACHT domain-containing protein [Streptomyces sp. yr375]|uniref:NACHT domain-containing protein n=1 Tax=Streptomyces sp. yr375 TaxID=1761906 RepID=UPI0008B287EE|nr:NACHT domain-containing protein [Streptomyces sp. yr375]SES27225.1 NACHT domain-containing protein [Streptomyces sp. yr375]
MDLAGQLDELAALYERTRSGWFMVLGGPGSGKTVLALRFARTRLKLPPDADKAPIPVIFSLGSWDPDNTSLRDWMIGQLERDHPFLAGVDSRGSTWARALVEAGYVLPILDGFDEIARGLRAHALRELNGSTRPLLVTSRRDGLEDAVQATKVVPAAVGIELTALPLDDTLAYLRRATRTPLPDTADTTAPTRWTYVLGELARRPRTRAGTHLTAVLTSPLMVTLARAVYESDRDPSELLDDEELGSTQGALETHLLDNFVPAAYARFLSNRPAADHRRWDPERARHWLGYLAAHLRELRTQDIEWWRLGTSMTLSARMLVVGVTVGLLSWLAVGIAFGSTLGIVYGRAWWFGEGVVDIVLNGLGIGPAFGLIHGFATKLEVGGPAFEPSRMRIQLRGGTKKVRESFLPRVRGGLAAGLVFGVVFGLGGAAYCVFLGCPWLVIALVFGNGFLLGIGLGLAVGLTVALMAGFEAVYESAERETFAGPSALLDTNRRTVLTQMLAVGLVTGLGYGIVVGLVNGFWPALGSGLAAALAVGLGLGTLTAWGRWVVLARVWLPLTGRLPRTVDAFLDDAYQRGVLRRSGAVYQFRHARLRDHLGEAYEKRAEKVF